MREGLVALGNVADRFSQPGSTIGHRRGDIGRCDPLGFLLDLGTIVWVLLVVWYASANYRWSRLIKRREPELVIDPIVEPGAWASTSPRRLRGLLQRLRSPASDPQVEMWRVRTDSRFLVVVTVGPILFLGSPIAVSILDRFIAEMLRRHDLAFGAGVVAIGSGVLAYYLYRLVLVSWRFGNGQPVRRVEFVRSLGGVAGTLGGLLLMTVIPIGRS